MLQAEHSTNLSYKEQIFQHYQVALQSNNSQQSLELLHLIHKNNWNSEWLAYQQSHQTVTASKNKRWPWSR